MRAKVLTAIVVLCLCGSAGAGARAEEASASRAEDRFTSKGQYAEEITRERVALFHEPGFPSQSPRPADWYREVLSGEGLTVTVIGVKELCDAAKFCRKNFDTLVMATGGLLPVDSEEPIGLFLNAGGNVVVDGNTMLCDWKGPREGAAGTVFRYDAERERWVGAVNSFNYTAKTGFASFNEFLFSPWPNHRSTYPGYCRHFNEDLKQNPLLADAGLLKDFPDILPKAVRTDDGKQVVASPRRDDGLFRVQPARGLRGSALVPQWANNLLVPVYVFEKVSNRSYSGLGISDSYGRHPKDRDSDFYIYRYHSALRARGGATLIHFGRSGAHLLRSDRGKQTLLAALHLAESRLPGERSEEFIEVCNRFDAELSRYYGKAIGCMETLVKVALLHHYLGREAERDEALKLHLEQRKTFEKMSYRGERLLSFLFEKRAAGHEDRLALIRGCSALSAELDELLQEHQAVLLRDGNIPAPAEVANERFKKIYFSVGGVLTGGITRLKKVYPLLKEIGFTDGPLYHRHVGGLRHSEELFKLTGLRTGYFMHTDSHSHRSQSPFDSGKLNPETGEISERKERWWLTPESWDLYEKDVSWFLKKLNVREDISNVTFLSERNMAFEFWGKYLEKLFRDYLRGKYKNIDALNRRWGTTRPIERDEAAELDELEAVEEEEAPGLGKTPTPKTTPKPKRPSYPYRSFDDIVLPTKRPVTRQEHALWEDWTRYREIWRLEHEVRPRARIAKKHAPNLFPTAYCTYHYRHTECPANGINFYEYGKVFDPNGFELNGGLLREVIAADITGFHHRTVTSEWGAFYFAPSAQWHKLDRLKSRLWNGVAWGQIGWHTFDFGSGSTEDPNNVINLNNHIRPLGWQFKEINRDFRKLSHIFIDGEREQPPVRILYSPTTRRHTCWPGIEKDKSMEAVVGDYDALRANHTQARAIDEGAIMDGHLPKACRLLVVPQATYVNDQLLGHLREFIAKGGRLLITPDSGRFDQYGLQRDSLLSMAGVSPAAPEDPTIALDGGKLYASSKRERVKALSVLFPDETQVIARFRSGEAAITRTRCGEGAILVTGVPFGRDYREVYSVERSEIALSLLSKMLDAAGIRPTYLCADTHLIVRPWRYKQKRYLALTYPTRPGLVELAPKTGDFPFGRYPKVPPFSLRIRGNWTVKDTLLGVSVPVSFDGQYTTVNGMVPSPGGLVYELAEGPQEAETGGEGEAETGTPGSAPGGPEGGGGKGFSLPFKGRLFASQGEVKMGDYAVSLELGAAGRDLHVRMERDGERLRGLCKSDKTIVLNFIHRRVAVACIDACRVYPVSLECRITESDPPPIKPGCEVREEDFLGQKSIVIENGFLRVRVLPGLGGRIIEFVSKCDGLNYMLCSRSALADGWGKSWVNYGGMEENAGKFPGPFWNATFQHRITDRTPNEVGLLLLRTKPIDWGPKKYSLEKEYVLRKGESKLLVKCRMFNETPAVNRVCLRTHPVMMVGGDIDPSDAFYYDAGGSAATIRFRPDAQSSLKNRGAWAALIDGGKKKGVVQLYDKDAVSSLYYLMGAGKTGWNLELTTVRHELEPGKCLEFQYDLGFLQGAAGLSGLAGNLGVHVALPGRRIYGRNTGVKIQADLASLLPRKAAAKMRVENRAGESVGEFEFETTVSPQAPQSRSFIWNTRDLPDGRYAVVLRAHDPDGKEILALREPFVLAGEKQDAMFRQIERFQAPLEKLKQEYGRRKSAELRQRVTRICILLAEIRDAIRANDARTAESKTRAVETLLNEEAD